MKDIYELLNQVEVDEDEIPQAEVSEFEKERLKKNLLNKVKNKRVNKGLIAVATVFFIIGGTAIIGIINPAFAKDIPLLEDTFKEIRNYYYKGAMVEPYDEYKGYCDNINLIQESNGIKITIKDAVFDGKTIFYTYRVESDKFLGRNILTYSYIEIDGEEPILPDRETQLNMVSEGMYINQNSINLGYDSDEIKFKLKFISVEDIDTGKEIKGDWNFDISLKAVESEKEDNNESIENNGVKLNIENIEKTPMSVRINYSQEVSDELLDKWNSINPVLSFKDDVGNYYRCEENSNHYVNAQSNTYYCDMIGKIDEKATKLIITPVIELCDEIIFDEKGFPIGKIDISSENNIKTDTIVFKDDLIIDLK